MARGAPSAVLQGLLRRMHDNLTVLHSRSAESHTPARSPASPGQTKKKICRAEGLEGLGVLSALEQSAATMMPCS